MGDTRLLFEEYCEYRYIPGMEAELIHADKLRNVSNDFMDRVLMSGDVSYTDYFYLRAVAFYRFATAEMIAEYLVYFKNYYGAEEYSKLLLPNAFSADVLGTEEHLDKEVDIIRYRLNRLARKYFLYSYTVSNEREGKTEYSLIYCINYQSYKVLRSVFGDTPCFSDEEIGYEKFYCITPIQRMMEGLHACRVAVLGFRNHGKRSVLTRDKEMIFGAFKNKLYPTMTAEVTCGETHYRIIVESIHFAVDERIVTASEHISNIENLVKKYRRLVHHYNYMEGKRGEDDELWRVRFLIAVENLDGMNKIVRLMNDEREKFSEKVFFTTDKAILKSGKLENSILMAKSVKSRITNEVHLGLVKPTRESLLASNNEWVLE